jgi:hypothetical protein
MLVQQIESQLPRPPVAVRSAAAVLERTFLGFRCNARLLGGSAALTLGATPPSWNSIALMPSIDVS